MNIFFITFLINIHKRICPLQNILLPQHYIIGLLFCSKFSLNYFVVHASVSTDTPSLVVKIVSVKSGTQVTRITHALLSLSITSSGIISAPKKIAHNGGRHLNLTGGIYLALILSVTKRTI